MSGLQHPASTDPPFRDPLTDAQGMVHLTTWVGWFIAMSDVHGELTSAVVTLQAQVADLEARVAALEAA